LRQIEAASYRRAAADRPLFHDDEAQSLQMLHGPLGDDARHDLAGVANLLSAAVAQREGERIGEVRRTKRRRITTAIG